MQAQSVGTQGTPSFCRHCGRRLEGGNSFCTGCGSTIEQAPPSAAPPQVEAAGSLAPPQQVDVAPATPLRLPDLRLATVIVVCVAILAVAWPLVGWVLSRSPEAVEPLVEVPVASVAPQQDLSAGPFTCVSNGFGYEITVPRSWAMATRNNAACRQFAVPLLGESSALVTVMPEQGDFDEVGPQGDVLEQEEGNIGDVRATFYKSIVSNDSRELSVYGYILEQDGTAFVVALVTNAGIEIPKETRQTFDQVVRQIEFD
jgi:hypothetical protein